MTALEALLRKQDIWALNEAQVERTLAFYARVKAENQLQNLTRMISPEDFFDGHVLDVLHLEKTGWVDAVNLDLGAGLGVPGLLHAVLFGEGKRSWISVDSEIRKAEFVGRVADEFGLDVTSFGKRVESVLQTEVVGTIFSRAVGPIERIMGWIHLCSTWNTLVLFKGPAWEAEWAAFQVGKHRKKLRLVNRYDYAVGSSLKKRCLIRLERTQS